MKAFVDGLSNGSESGWMIWYALADGLMVCKYMEDGLSTVDRLNGWMDESVGAPIKQ